MVGIYGIIREFPSEKSPETVDATGFSPVASIPFGFYGDPAGIRTPDTLLKRQVLCLLSYWVILKWCADCGRARWLGWQDSNLQYQSQSLVCYRYTTSHHRLVQRGRHCRPPAFLGWEMGLEPTTPGTTIRCSYQLSYTHHSWSLALARQEGLEPPAYCLEGSCSILLSYWRLFSRQLAPAPGFPRTRPQAQLYYHPRSHLSSVPRAFPHVISIFYLTRSS